MAAIGSVDREGVAASMDLGRSGGPVVDFLYRFSGTDIDVLGDCFVRNADSWSGGRGPAICGHG